MLIDLSSMDAIDWNMLVICFVFIVLDIATGVLKACFAGEFSSSVMRTGMQHKAGTLLTLLLSGVCDMATSSTTVKLGIPFGVIDVFGVMVIAMEIGSILENAVAMNPDLGKLKLFEIFGVTKSEGE